MTPRELEMAILNAVAKARTDDWLPCTLGDLRNRLREISVDAANATIETIADAAIALAQDGLLALGKREYGGKRMLFDFQRQFDRGYTGNFFATGSFDLRLTHEGRKRLHDSQVAELQVTPVVTAVEDDIRFAQQAIQLARQSVREDNTRPFVGAVVVKDTKVLSTAFRGETPKCHAEFIALDDKLADVSVVGATVYTTLEPCTKRNPPKVECAQRIIDRKVGRVVIGMLDPNPDIQGFGYWKLRNANIDVQLFPRDLANEVQAMNRDFMRDQQRKHAAKVTADPPSMKAARSVTSATMDLEDATEALFALHTQYGVARQVRDIVNEEKEILAQIKTAHRVFAEDFDFPADLVQVVKTETGNINIALARVQQRSSEQEMHIALTQLRDACDRIRAAAKPYAYRK